MADAHTEELRTEQTRSLSDRQLASEFVSALGHTFANTDPILDRRLPERLVGLMLGDVDSVHVLPGADEYHEDAQPFMAEVLARIAERHADRGPNG